MVRPNYNLIRFIRRNIRTLKKEYGGPITLYSLDSATTNLQTGVKSVSRSSLYISRAVVLPNNLTREAVQTISIISANKKVVQGGTYDPGERKFIIDRSDAPGWELVYDDWIVYNGKRYDIKKIEEFEQSTAWLVIGREVERVIPAEDHYGYPNNYLGLTDSASYVKNSYHLMNVSSSLNLSDLLVGTKYGRIVSNDLTLLSEVSVLKEHSESVSSTLNFSQNNTDQIIKVLEQTLNLVDSATGTVEPSAAACPDLDWTNVGTSYWSDYQSYIQANDTTNGSDATDTFNATSNGYIASALAVDSETIYCIPFSGTVGLKIDTVNQTTSNWGTFNSDTAKWSGAVLAHDGDIYAIPRSTGNVLVIDTVNDTTSNISVIGGAVSNGWYGGVLAGNGNIYCVPYTSNTVLKVDTVNSNTSNFGTLNAANGWAGGTLAPNGNIYCTPLNATEVLKINTSNDTVSAFGTLSSNTSKWLSGVLADTGFIYCCPYVEGNILKIDTVNDTTSTTGSFAGSLLYRSGVLAPNGFIYFLPFDATSILKLNPDTDNTTTLSSPAGIGRISAGFVAKDGLIYGVPFTGNLVLVIDPDTDTIWCEQIIRSAYWNRT